MVYKSLRQPTDTELFTKYTVQYKKRLFRRDEGQIKRNKKYEVDKKIENYTILENKNHLKRDENLKTVHYQ